MSGNYILCLVYGGRLSHSLCICNEMKVKTAAKIPYLPGGGLETRLFSHLFFSFDILSFPNTKLHWSHTYSSFFLSAAHLSCPPQLSSIQIWNVSVQNKRRKEWTSLHLLPFVYLYSLLIPFYCNQSHYFWSYRKATLLILFQTRWHIRLAEHTLLKEGMKPFSVSPCLFHKEDGCKPYK